MFEVFGRASSAGTDGVSSMNREALPPCASVAAAPAREPTLSLGELVGESEHALGVGAWT